MTKKSYTIENPSADTHGTINGREVLAIFYGDLYGAAASIADVRVETPNDVCGTIYRRQFFISTDGCLTWTRCTKKIAGRVGGRGRR